MIRWTPEPVVPARGAQRRLQALVCLGWSETELARRVGVSQVVLARWMRRRKHVTVTTHARVVALYDQLWSSRPPQQTGAERARARTARARAAAAGWVPPLAWDDIDEDPAPPDAPADPALIDVVAIEYARQGLPVQLTVTERRLAVAEMRGRYSHAQLAHILSVSVKTIERDVALLDRGEEAA